MSSANMMPRKGNAREIPFDEWIPFLAEFTRQNRGAHARLEVFGPDVGYQVETEDQPFDGVAADVKRDERSIWFHFGTTPANHLSHGVHSATAIWALPPGEGAGAVLAVEASDGTRTVLQLSRPEDYELPPGSTEGRRS